MLDLVPLARARRKVTDPDGDREFVGEASCTHEYLLAFSCKCRYFCPSCYAKRLAIWTHWLDATLLEPVPHRQVVLTIPKRLRAYCFYQRRLPAGWGIRHVAGA